MFLSAGLALVVIANLNSFQDLESRAGIYFRAIHAQEDPGILAASVRLDPNARSRYSPHAVVGLIAPGSTVTMSAPELAGDLPTRQRMYSFGAVAQIVWHQGSSADQLSGLDVTRNVIAAGPGGWRGAPWMVLVEDAEASAVDPEAFLSLALAGDVSFYLGAREFVYVHWPVPREGSSWNYQRLYIEASLLDEATGAGSAS